MIAVAVFSIESSTGTLFTTLQNLTGSVQFLRLVEILFRPNYLNDVIFEKNINWFDDEKNELGFSLYKSFRDRIFALPHSYLILVSDGSNHKLVFYNGATDKDYVECRLDEARGSDSIYFWLISTSLESCE